MLERASIKSLSEEVKHRRWNMIGHILRQDRNDDSRKGKENGEGSICHEADTYM